MNHSLREGRTAWASPGLAARAFVAVTVAAAVLLGLLAVGYGANAFLLVFAGTLLAILLRGFAGFIIRHTGLSQGKALAAVLALVLLLVCAAGWWAVPRISDQFDELVDAAPKAVHLVQDKLASYRWGHWLLAQMGQPEAKEEQSRQLVHQWPHYLSVATSVLGSILIFVFVALYLAVEPRLYLDGLLHLLPMSQRDLAETVLAEAEDKLRLWLMGRLASMAYGMVGTSVGLWILGIPLALILGLLAGLLGFVPYIGPILAAGPALLLAVPEGSTTVLWVASIYVTVQITQDYVLAPLIQRWTISLPPALMIGSQIAMGFWAGALGVILAPPLLVVSMVFIRKVWVEHYLGDFTMASR